MRTLISGILAGQEFDSVLVGDASLSKRPMKRIIEPLSLMGAKIEAVDGHAPLTISGCNLQGIIYNSKLSSAQVKSCILLAGINKNTQGQTVYIEPEISRNHTELMLKYLGADIVLDKERGPMMLEINARPGLAIQIANGCGLKGRLEEIDTFPQGLTAEQRIDWVLNYEK